MKKQLQRKKQKKKEDKELRKQERQENATSGKLEDMIAYVDEFGVISSTPPEEKKEEDASGILLKQKKNDLSTHPGREPDMLPQVQTQ